MLQRQDLQEIRNKESVPNKKVDFDNLIGKLQGESKDAEGANTVNLVIDPSKKDIGSLIKLNALQKRLACVKHIIGGWKPSQRHATVTDQVCYVQKRLDLLDAAKMKVFMKRASFLVTQLDEIKSSTDA